MEFNVYVQHTVHRDRYRTFQYLLLAWWKRGHLRCTLVFQDKLAGTRVLDLPAKHQLCRWPDPGAVVV
jgi:hypothetical protein